METLLVLLVGCFVLLPLPLCIYLLVQSKRLSERLDTLESEIRRPTVSRSSDAIKRVVEPKPPQGFAPVPPSPTPPTPPAPQPAPSVSAPSIPSPPPEPARPAPTAASKRTSPSPPSDTASPIASFLRSIGLLPPLEMERNEAGIIQWWALRIGGLLAVLTAVFFSVYISQNTSPLVRFSELLAADLAVIGIAAFFWKRQRRFSAILLSAGLSMLYVSMVAGYAASPVRVFTNPLVGIAAQIVVITLIYATSIRLQERPLALLATAFGYASSIFAAYVGYNEGALLTALGLLIAGNAFGARWRYLPLVTLSTLGVYLPLLSYCGLAVIDSQSFTTSYSISVVAFLALSVSTFPFTAWKTDIASDFSPALWRTLAIANTSLCGALGYAYFKLTANDLTLLYAILAPVFLAWATLFAKRGLNTLFFQLFFLKGSGLAALWLAHFLTGELRWFALGIECLLIAWSTRKSLSRWSEAATFLLWGAALWLAASEMPRDASLAFPGPPWTFYALLPLLGAAALAFQKHALPSVRDRNVLYTLTGLLSGAFASFVVQHAAIANAHHPIHLAGFATAFAALCLIPKLSKLPLATAAVPPILIAHGAFWTSPSSTFALFAVLAVSATFAWAAAAKIGKPYRSVRNLPELALVLLSVTSLYAYLYDGYNTSGWLPFVAPLLAIVLKTVRIPPLRVSTDALLLPLLLDILFLVHEPQPLATRIACLILYGALLATPLLRPQRERSLSFLRKSGLGRKSAHFLVTLFALLSASQMEAWLATRLTLLGAAIALFGLWLLHRHRSALLLSLGLLALELYALAINKINYGPNSPWSWQILLVGAILAASCLAFGAILYLRPARRIKFHGRQLLAYALAIFSYLAAAFSFAYPPLSLDSYYTPAIAIYCLALVCLGIAIKVKPFRMIALAGFLLPLLRLFLVDIQETLHRIIAFAALAILLTAIGYLYNRFASRID